MRYHAYKKVSRQWQCQCQRQQDPHQKQYVPLPFGRGHKYLQSVEKIQWKLLGGVDFTYCAVSNHYFLGAVVQVGYVKNPVSLWKNIFSA